MSYIDPPNAGQNGPWNSGQNPPGDPDDGNPWAASQNTPADPNAGGQWNAEPQSWQNTPYPQGQPGYSQGQAGYPQGQPGYGPGYEPLGGPPPKQRVSTRTKVIGSVAAIVVLAGGGTASYFAFASSDDSGANSPTAAVQAVVNDMQRSDLIGVLDDIAPGERDAFTQPLRDDIASLKRLGVLSSNADPSALTGVTFKASNFTYGSPVTINDHVQVVPITGGSVDVSADATKLPFTSRVLSQMTGAKKVSQHTRVQPGVRVAAENVGGRWYASLFYTIADSAAHHAVPDASDSIPAVGAASPQAAVSQMVDAALARNVRGMIQLVSPDELGALHDYGSLIPAVSRLSGGNTSGVSIQKLDLNATPISGGSRVTLSRLVLATNGRTVTVTHDGECYTASVNGQTRRICAADAVSILAQQVSSLRCAIHVNLSVGSSGNGYDSCDPGNSRVTAAQKTAFTHLFQGLFAIGIDTVQSGGSWYVAPVRTLADLGSTVLGGLRGNDLFALASLG